MYSRVLDDLKVVLGRSSKRYQDILITLAALDNADDSLMNLRKNTLN